MSNENSSKSSKEEHKPTIALVFLGHVDHGKSTILGHFLYEMGIVDPRTMEKIEQEAKMRSMEAWKWAYVLDTLPEEQERGKTADIAFEEFETQKYHFVIIDAPGHRDYTSRMIRGAAQADAAILVVSAVPAELKAGLKRGSLGNPGGQTREHAILGSVLGIEQVLVAVNKMDLVDYSEQAFVKAVKAILDLFKDIQSPWANKVSQNHFIPVTGWYGDNLTTRSEKMPWYNGPTLLEALDIFQPPKPKVDLPLRFIVNDAFEMVGTGMVLQGRVVSGSLKVDQEVNIIPYNEKCLIKKVWDTEENPKNILIAGEHGIILPKGVDKERLDEGIVLADKSHEYVPVDKILVKLLVMERPLNPGINVVLHCGTAHTSARLERILSLDKINPTQKKVRRTMGENIILAFPNEVITAEISIDSPIVIEKFSEFPELGRVILRSGGLTIGVGLVQKLFYDSKK